MSESKRCARCGANFGCGRNDADCWCSRLPPLPASALNGMADCYCPTCLAALLNDTTTDTPTPPAQRADA